MTYVSHALIPLMVVLFTVLGLPSVQQLQGPVILSDEQNEYTLGLHLEVLEDADKVWTIDDVTDPDIAGQFVPSQAEVPSFGFTDSAYWVRFRVRNEADEVVRWLLKVESSLFFIDMYLPTADPQVYETVQTGSALPFDTRDVDHPDYLFDLRLRPGEEKTVHLRFESEAAMRLPLTILSFTALAQKDLIGRTINGFIYGMLLIMVGYNLILFLYLRDTSYLYFALFLTSTSMSFLWAGNISHRYLWPSSGRFNAIAGQLFFVLSMVFTLKFTSVFLVTKAHTPRLHTGINVLILTFCASIPIQFIDLGIAARPVFVLTVISYLLIIVVGIIIWRQGYRPARYFVLAWLLWLTSTLLYVLSLAGLIPFAFLAQTGAELGLMILTLTLSLALVDRINILKEEREDAQLEVVRQQQEAIRLKDEFATTLQERVEERTAELVTARNEAEEARHREAARRRVAEGLSDVIAALNSDQSLRETLDLITARTRALLQASVALICSLDTESETLSVQSGQGFRNDNGDLSALAPDYALVKETLALEEPTVLSEPQHPLLSSSDTYQALMIVPIYVEEILPSKGMLLYYSEPPFLSEDETELASLFAAQAALAIESAELKQKAEQTAVSGERDRIGRDLHDSVTQALFSASLIAEALPGVWERHPETALSSLQELRSLTQGALAEMRSLLMELRPGELTHRTLSELLRQRADATSARTESPITVTVTGDYPLAPEVQIALYRIAQEALNNVVKHARADRAAVNLDCSLAGVTLCVSDNGRGFNPEGEAPHHLGLNIMRERAQAIGARLTINSEPGQGTEVAVEWIPSAKESDDG